MTAVRTQTLLARHIGERVHIITTAGGITGTLNSVAYAHEDDPQPTAVHLVATEPHDAPVTIPWHAITTLARTPDPDVPALTTRVEVALDALEGLRELAHRIGPASMVQTLGEVIDILTGEAP